jgi:acyl transferase domain-containing protein/acyl carrier protein
MADTPHRGRSDGPPRDPVAVVGIGCALPGARGPAELWDLLVSDRDSIGDIPAERFDVDRWFDPVPGKPGRIATRRGGFLFGVDRFDAAFFGMSAEEALRLDPQHRLMLETVWEALEDAGLPAERLAGSRTGVYTSSLAADYWDAVRGAGLYDMDAATGTGSWGLPSGRISRLLDLRGPSMGVQATCASALLAVHLACQDIWSGQTDAAVVSGVNLLLSPDLYFSLSESEILSPGGLSRFGDADVDGYVRSEGAVTVVLKPLSAALRDHDRVYATVLGSAATNNGAASANQAAPGVAGQCEALRAAYRDAGVAPGDVDVVEAHGAGTPKGDEVELTALDAVLREGRATDRRCELGSVKSNVGHTEAAAGLVGLVKAALAVHHRTIPATLHVDRPHPLLEAPGSPLVLTRERRPWPDTGRPAVAGVSSFGLSATNVHVVLGEVRTADRDTAAESGGPCVLPLSARDPRALRDLAGSWARLLDGPVDLPALSRGAAARRTHHGHRLAVVGDDPRAVARDLRAHLAGATPDSVHAGERTGPTPRVVFVFSGQGSQWPGMCRTLLEHDPVFRARMDECDEAVRSEAGWSPVDLLSSDAELSDEDVVQPTLWAAQVALAAVWEARGVTPDLVVGHSMGEIAAACVTGALSLRDGAAVVCRRSALVRDLALPGAMVAVQLGEAQARAAAGGAVSVGVVNSAHSTVLAGEPGALERVVAPLRARGVFCREVRVRYASHSPRVDPLREPLLAALRELEPRRGRVPLVSTVVPGEIAGDGLDADYWWANLREPVRFADAVDHVLSRGGPVLFVEVSTHPLLLHAVEDAVEETRADAAVVGTLTRGADERTSLLAGVAAAYAHGVTPDWRPRPGDAVRELPGYPWQRESHWVGPTGTGVPLPPPTTEVEDDAEVLTADGALDADAPLSGLSFLAPVITAATGLVGGADVLLDDVVADEPPGGGRALRAVLTPAGTGWVFDVRVRTDGAGGVAGWRSRARGVLRIGEDKPPLPPFSPSLVRRWCAEEVLDDRAAGFAGLWRRDGEAVGALPPAVDGAPLACCARALAAALPAGWAVGGRATAARVAEVRVRGDLATAVWVHARLLDADHGGGTAVGEVVLADAAHRTVAQLRGVRLGGTARPGVERVVVASRRATPPVDVERRARALVARALNVPEDVLDADVPLPLLGVDSLRAVGLRGGIAREFGVHLPVRLLLGGRTLADLVADLAAGTVLTPPAATPAW